MRMIQERQDSSAFSSSSSSPSISTISETIDLVSSLIRVSYAIKQFTGKWAFIRNKLEELSSDLMAIETCDSTENPILSGLVSAITATLKDSHELAQKCLNLSYNGILQMKSELNVAALKFDRHVRNLSGLCASGVLTHASAIVVSRPPASARKEDLRFYVKDLAVRMKIGDSDMKRQALSSLHEVVAEDERYVKIVFETTDIANMLVAGLESEEPDLLEQAAKIVSLLCGFGSYKSVLVGAGVIGPLVRVLERGNNPTAKDAAASSLSKLTENSDNAWSVSAHGGVTAILSLCARPDQCPLISTVCHCCRVLTNVLDVDEIKRFIVEEGGVPRFIVLMKSKEEKVQICCLEFLKRIATEETQRFIEGGGLKALLEFLDPRNNLSRKSKEMALLIIERLSISPLVPIQELMNHGFLKHLLFYLQNDVYVQEAAATVALKLSMGVEEVKREMGELGFMPELARLSDTKCIVLSESALESLKHLVSLPKNRRMFIEDDQSMRRVLRLLERDDSSAECKGILTSFLMSLTACNPGRKKISASECMKSIEKLADQDVPEARKLVKKLHTNRFINVFKGKWNL